MVVKKARRGNKGKIEANKDAILGKGTRESTNNKGSRFLVLMEEYDVGNADTNEQQERKEETFFTDKGRP